MKNISFLIVIFFANAIQAVTGFAGTVLAMPPSMYLIGMDNAKVVIGAITLLSGLLIAVSNYKSIQWKEFTKMAVFMFAGMIIGTKLYSVLPSDMLLKVYGFIILAVACKNLFLKSERELARVLLPGVLLAAGIVHGMFLSGGALLVIYAVQVLKNKEEFRATVALIWVFLNTFLMVGQLREGLYTPGNIHLILLSLIPLLLATWVGGKLAKQMKQSTFLTLTYILLIISGVSLIL
ncbi:MAG: sulfite exporter TauE/SafE family protein [Hespellia sp.]|nr:sulfite exporter TauE/SafE family protein [Hespellia sp.]